MHVFLWLSLLLLLYIVRNDENKDDQSYDNIEYCSQNWSQYDHARADVSMFKRTVHPNNHS